MNRIADIVSKMLSVVLYPLFIPTYGMVLFCALYGKEAGGLPILWSVIAVSGTMVLTCLLPIFMIWRMMRRGEVADMQIANAKERFFPYLYSAIWFGCWAYFMSSILHAPEGICYVAWGATAALGVVCLINLKWKISAHLTGLGGLTGGVFSYYLSIGAIPSAGTIGLWLGLSLLLMYARLRLNAHTSAQVCAGWLLGIICTFIPYCITLYAA